MLLTDYQALAETSNTFGPSHCTWPGYDVNGVWYGALGFQ